MCVCELETFTLQYKEEKIGKNKNLVFRIDIDMYLGVEWKE